MEKLKITAIIQARVNSSRLPNKIFMELAGMPLIYHVVSRLKKSKFINKVVVSTTKRDSDSKIAEWCVENSVSFFRGSENNVLERYYETAKHYESDIVIRITGDDPFKDYRLIDTAINRIIDDDLDFVTNNNPPTYPEGLDVEVFTFNTLKSSYLNAKTNFEKEHVTQYVYKNASNFKLLNLTNKIDLSFHRWTIDTMEDYLFSKFIYDNLYRDDKNFLTEKILSLLNDNPKILELNNKIKRSNQYNK